MRLSVNPKLHRRRTDSSDASSSASVATLKKVPVGESESPEHDPRSVIQPASVDDAFARVISELSHDLRQPLTSLNMNLQTAVKMLQLPTPQISGALEALGDCLSTERDMVELVAHARRRAASVSAHACIPLNDVARDLLLTACNLEPSWRVRLSDRLASPSPVVTSGFIRLRLALLSILRRSLILDETERSSADGVIIETRSIDGRGELRFAGLPQSLPMSQSFQSLHMLITTLVSFIGGHAYLAVHDECITFVISTPVAPASTLHLPGARHGV